MTLPIAIYYEQPNWFKPLFAELDRRGTSYVKLFAPDHTWAPEDRPEEKYALVFNRMSPSAWNRDHGDQIFYTLGFLEHLESRGVRVLNGLAAISFGVVKGGTTGAAGVARAALSKNARDSSRRAGAGRV